MYCVFDDDYNIIAYHDELYVVSKYVRSIFNCHGIELGIGKIKNNSDKLKGKDDLYLIRYADTYVQLGYLQYIDIFQTQFIEDDEKALNVIRRILEVTELKDKERKILNKACKVIKNILDDDREYTSSLDELKQLKYRYDPYIYNRDLL